MTKFEVGKTYTTRSSCDHECVFVFHVVARTEKTVTFTYHGDAKRRGLRVYDGRESFRPFGSYSMAAVVHA